MSTTFTAIDFELATADYTSVCSVGIVKVVDGQIVDEFHSLIQPPQNKYMWQTTRVHGIKAKDTKDAATFLAVFPQIESYLKGQVMVAHNEKFDREVLMKTMAAHGLDYKSLALAKTWICTSKLYSARGFKKTKLSICCAIMNVELNHHDALSDARACAQLYLMQDQITPELLEKNFPQNEIAKDEIAKDAI